MMMIVLPGYTAVAPSPGASMIHNPFPCGTVAFLLWSQMWRANQRFAWKW